MSTAAPTRTEAGAPSAGRKPATGPSGSGGGRSGSSSATRGDGLAGWLFMAPYLLLFVVFVLAPIVYGLWISLHEYDFTLPERPFVGLGNYTGLLDGSSPFATVFWESMQATWLFTLVSVPLLLVLPLAVAVLLNLKLRGRTAFRALYFAPYVLGVAVVSVLFRYLLDANVGLINRYLGAEIPWLTSLPWAWVALVLVTVWWTLGFNVVIYLAALQDISPELYEAARMDGAGTWQRFLNVTWPGLRPVSLFVVSVTLIGSVNMFGQSFLMTGGGPGTETRTAIYQIADTGLLNFNSGAAAAMSTLFTISLMLASAAVFFLFRERDGDPRRSRRRRDQEAAGAVGGAAAGQGVLA